MLENGAPSLIWARDTMLRTTFIDEDLESQRPGRDLAGSCLGEIDDNIPRPRLEYLWDVRLFASISDRYKIPPPKYLFRTAAILIVDRDGLNKEKNYLRSATIHKLHCVQPPMHTENHSILSHN